MATKRSKSRGKQLKKGKKLQATRPLTIDVLKLGGKFVTTTGGKVPENY